MTAERLQPGDVLLYPPTSLFGRLIAIKTWHGTAHVEVYIGNGQSVASRDGQGVAIYPARLHDVRRALRPVVPFDLAAAMAWFHAEAEGQPYGWLDLAAFFGVTRDFRGMVCSALATAFLRAGRVAVFRLEAPQRVAPYQFEVSELLADLPAA